jgi:hypothetical protein
VIANFESFSKFAEASLFDVVALATAVEVPAYVWPQTVDGRTRTCACADAASREDEISAAESRAMLSFALFVLDLPHILRNAIRVR